MRLFVIDNGRSIYSVEVAKETPKCYIVDRSTQTDHWLKTWSISDRVWKEKDRWFTSLIAAIDGLLALHLQEVSKYQEELADATRRHSTLLAAREEFTKR